MKSKSMYGAFLSLLVLCFLTSNLAFAQYATTQPYYGSVSFVPAGTPISVSLSQALGSEFSRPGETFTATLTTPIYGGSGVVAPAGSQVQGTVVDVRPAGRAGEPGSMDLRLTNVITPSGKMIPLSASMDQANFQLKADGGKVSHLAKTTAIGAAGGALSGLIGGAISGGKKGKATAIGTGIGAGVGLLGGAIQKGKELIIESGTALPFRLDQPIQAAGSGPVSTTQVQQYHSESYYNPQGGFADPTQTYQTQPISNPYLNP